MVWYLDTSAFLKLVVAEEASTAMRRWFARAGPCWSSYLLRTEALRSATRLGIEHQAVADALDAVSLVLPAASTFLAAANLGPPALRSLDALHLATALELADDLQGLVSYDARMVEGADTCAIPVVTPR